MSKQITNDSLFNEFNFVMYCSLDFALNVLKRKLNQISSYGLILHDKDVNKDGVLKEQHLHLYLRLKVRRKLGEIKSWFVAIDDKGLSTNVLFNPVKTTTKDCILYLTHANDKTKYQYDVSLLYKYNIDFDSLDDIAVDSTYDILRDFMNGSSLLDMVKRYGKDFLYHYNCYKDIKCDIEKNNYYFIKEDDNLDYKCSCSALCDVNTGELIFS